VAVGRASLSQWLMLVAGRSPYKGRYGKREAIAMVRDERITDAKTIAAVLWLRSFGA